MALSEAVQSGHPRLHRKLSLTNRLKDANDAYTNRARIYKILHEDKKAAADLVKAHQFSAGLKGTPQKPKLKSILTAFPY